MRRKLYNHSWGFTLIELLVVIAVIALLVAIVLPALGKAKIYAQKVVCRSNIKQIVLGMRLYSEQNDDELPVDTRWGGVGGAWFWDYSFWATNQIMDYANMDYQIFDCPSEKFKNPADARFWQFSRTSASTSFVGLADESGLSLQEQCSNFRVLPYIFLVDRIEMKPNPTGVTQSHGDSYRPAVPNDPGFKWARKTTDVRNSGTRELVMDTVISTGSSPYNFVEVSGGSMTKYGIYDTTCHVKRQNFPATASMDVTGDGAPDLCTNRVPDGGNVGYLDGHVEWRSFEDMRYRIGGTRFYW